MATDDTASAAREYQRVLDVGVDIDSPPIILTAPAGLAARRPQQGEREEALELACFVLRHSASERQLHDQVALQVRLAIALEPRAMAVIQDRSRARTLEAILTAVRVTR